MFMCYVLCVWSLMFIYKKFVFFFLKEKVGSKKSIGSNNKKGWKNVIMYE